MNKNRKHLKKYMSGAMALLVAGAAASQMMPVLAAPGAPGKGLDRSPNSAYGGTAPVGLPGDDGSITVRAAGDQSLEGKTFTAYKLFDLTYLNTGEGDTNEDDDYAYDLLTEYEALFTSGAAYGGLGLSVPDGETVDQAAYDYVSGCTKEELNLFTKTAYDWSQDKKISGITGVLSLDKKSYLIDGLEDGYYLVFETVTEDGGTLSRGVLSTVVAEVDSLELTDTGVKDVVVTQKADIPKLEKEIYHNELGTWGDVGDNAIGDTVQYRIHTTIPDTFGYESYRYVIHDYMEAGLTFRAASVKLYTDAEKTEPVNAGWTLTEDKDDGCDFEVSVDRATLDSLYAAGERDLYLYFDCTLNEKAEIADEHNDNTAHLEYSNNPYMDTTTTGRPDTVYDYTFTFDGTKVNADNATLKNAEFRILKDGSAVDLLRDSDNVYYVKGTLEDGSGMTATDTIVTEANGKIVIRGLDDAVTYTLRETKAPAGYVKAADIVFTLNAAYNPATNLLESLTEDNALLEIVEHQAVGTILDEAQPPLPVTGGVGTAIFYVLAGVSGTAAAVCLFASRKKPVRQ